METTSTDAGFGAGILFGVLAVAAAVGMYVAQSQANTAWAFAGAVALAVVSVAAFHLYG